MTQDEIIEMAREAGGCDITSHGWTSWVGTQSTEFLERLTKLVAAKEREACAKLCESYTDKSDSDHETHGYACAAAIRARGEQA
jgi:hypothetical protein